MRTVETKIVNKVLDFQMLFVDKTISLSKRDVVSRQNGSVYVYLWNTPIATVTDSEIVLRSGGYRTVTTKSRLNAVLALAKGHWRIFQKDYGWFLYNANTGETINFSEGMKLPR